MKKVLFRVGALYQNGTEAFVMNVFRKLRGKDIHIDFLLNTPAKTPYYDEVIAAGSRVFICPPRKPNPIKSFVSEVKFFKLHSKDYDAVHFCYGSLSDISLIVLAYYYKIPIRILHSHNSSCKFIHSKILHRLFKPIANKMTTHHFACSKKAGDFFASKGYQYIIINNGIDIEKYSFNYKKRKEIRERLPIADDCLLIGHVGRFTEVKNHKFILEIFNEFIKKDPNTQLMLIGVGELENEIENMAKRMGIIDKIHFMGLRTDVGELMQAMDLFLMPSLFEGLPFVLVEAQAAGLPCFISDNIDKGSDITGNVKMLSLSFSAEEWASAIFSYMKDYRRSNQDAKIISNGYDINSTANYLYELYISNVTF